MVNLLHFVFFFIIFSRIGVLDSLAKVLLNPHSPSPCITIPPSVDKRIQIVYRKEFPHVVYCRLWRFADLQNYHELVPSSQCHYPFSPGNNRNQKFVCINPYHYNRVASQGNKFQLNYSFKNDFHL
jgi:MAD (mothers against decapentaplegic) family protein 1